MHELKFIYRPKHSYEFVNKFKNQENNFNRQYSHIYSERLLVLKPAFQKFYDYPIKKLHEITTNQNCIVIGTLYKKMQLRPTIMKRIANEYLPAENIGKFIDTSDTIVIEDELQRASLIGNINKDKLVTGIICREDKSGLLNVSDIIYPPVTTNLIPFSLREEDKYVGIISGIGLCNSNTAMQQIQLLIDMITGVIFGEENALALEMQKIIRIVIAGNSLGKDIYEDNLITRAKYISNKVNLSSFHKVRELDALLTKLSDSVTVDLMPGLHDPTNAMLPQQPMKRCLLKTASTRQSLNMVPNPYEFIVDGIRILGTSGQNIEDIYRYTEFEDPLEILENTLRWCHIAPTCPDSLACYPFFNNEPFIITERPHVYFAGNQKEFKWKYVNDVKDEKTLILTIPEFCQDPQLVLINISKLTCHSVKLSI